MKCIKSMFMVGLIIFLFSESFGYISYEGTYYSYYYNEKSSCGDPLTNPHMTVCDMNNIPVCVIHNSTTCYVMDPYTNELIPEEEYYKRYYSQHHHTNPIFDTIFGVVSGTINFFFGGCIRNPLSLECGTDIILLVLPEGKGAYKLVEVVKGGKAVSGESKVIAKFKFDENHFYERHVNVDIDKLDKSASIMPMGQRIKIPEGYSLYYIKNDRLIPLKGTEIIFPKKYDSNDIDNIIKLAILKWYEKRGTVKVEYNGEIFTLPFEKEGSNYYYIKTLYSSNHWKLRPADKDNTGWILEYDMKDSNTKIPLYYIKKNN